MTVFITMFKGPFELEIWDALLFMITYLQKKGTITGSTSFYVYLSAKALKGIERVLPFDLE